MLGFLSATEDTGFSVKRAPCCGCLLARDNNLPGGAGGSCTRCGGRACEPGLDSAPFHRGGAGQLHRHLWDRCGVRAQLYARGAAPLALCPALCCCLVDIPGNAGVFEGSEWNVRSGAEREDPEVAVTGVCCGASRRACSWGPSSRSGQSRGVLSARGPCFCKLRMPQVQRGCADLKLCEE